MKIYAKALFFCAVLYYNIGETSEIENFPFYYTPYRAEIQVHFVYSVGFSQIFTVIDQKEAIL